MVVWHRTLSDRFATFSPAQQLIMVCNELNRGHNQNHNPEEYKNCLERALELMDFIIADPRWKPKLKEILRARDVIALYYRDRPKSTKKLQKALLQLEPEAWRMFV